MNNAIALRTCSIAIAVVAAAIVSACAQQPTSKTATVDRMYVFACGEARIPDVSPWSPGVNIGKSMTFSDNCYLIVHGGDLMMWDSGYSDALINSPDGVVGPRSTAFVKKTLASQLDELGIKPTQITRAAFSHTHADHVGNANLFTGAILYIQQPEFDAAFGADPGKFGFAPATYEQLRTNTIVKLNGDYDVFGDGSVTILSTPGHTPGHQSLLVRLPKTGAVVLSGDVAHFKDNFDNRRVPAFNYSKDQSLQSIDKLSKVVATEHAQLWINHDAAQSAGIPHAPLAIE